jgi:hypothetical protein
VRKLALDPGDLRVQSFAPMAAPAAAARMARAEAATVTCIYPRCGTVMRAQSCYNGCTDPEIC